VLPQCEPNRVTADRRLNIVTQFAASSGSPTDRLCTVCMTVTEMTGAGVMLMSGDVPRGSLCTTNEVSALVEELQLTLGEGPCIDAHNLARPVTEPDLANSTGRWPSFTPPALEAGVRAIFGFPLQVGSVRLGALNLYRDRPGALSDDQHADALVTADVVTQSVLSMQARAPSGELAIELEPIIKLRDVVHQATGMVAAQLGVSVGQAQIRLRAHAFADGRSLQGVAEDVVDRHLLFESGSEGPVVALKH
jgi:hypothetical protein